MLAAIEFYGWPALLTCPWHCVPL